MKKGKILLLAAVLVLALSQVAFPALTAVGPTNPANGFPLWYRDASGQTVTLSVPPNAASLPDPIIPGNAFSDQIGFGTEAFYWISGATMAVPGGTADLVLGLEAAFFNGDAAPNDQMVFARTRIRIDTAAAGTFTVTHPFGTKIFRNVPVGVRAINDTVDIGAARRQFSQALSSSIGPFLKAANAQPGFLGDGVTTARVTGSPTLNNLFRVVGPGVNAVTTLFTTGGELFAGTPFSVTRATFSRDAAGAAVAQVGVNIASPVPAGVILRAILPGQPAARLTRTGNDFFAAIPFTAAFNRNIIVRATVAGQRTDQPVTLNDLVTIVIADYSVGTQTLRIRANSTDALATLTGFGWAGTAANNQKPLRNSRVTTFTGVTPAPTTVRANSSSGGTASAAVTIVP